MDPSATDPEPQPAASSWAALARVGALVAAAAISSPALALASQHGSLPGSMIRATVSGAHFFGASVDTALGKVQNIAHAGVGFERSALDNWRAAREALRAPPHNRIGLGVETMSRWVADDFASIQLPERLRPEQVLVQARYVAPGDTNADMLVSKRFDDDRARTAELRVLVDSNGSWPMSLGDKGLMAQASAVATIAHEMGHSAFRPALRALGSSAPRDALAAAGLPPAQVASASEGARALFEKIWPTKILNESFSDNLMLSYMAKKLGREQFETFANAYEDRRKDDYDTLLAASRKAAAKGEPAAPEAHATYRGFQSMRARGYDELRSMQPEAAVSAAMASAHSGFLALVYDSRDIVGAGARQISGAYSAEAVERAGASLSRKFDAERSARASRAPILERSASHPHTQGREALESFAREPLVSDPVTNMLARLGQRRAAAQASAQDEPQAPAMVLPRLAQ